MTEQAVNGTKLEELDAQIRRLQEERENIFKTERAEKQKIVRDLVKTYQFTVEQVFEGFTGKIYKQETWTKEELLKLISSSEFGNYQPSDLKKAAAKADKAESGESNLRLPSVIYFNVQAKEGEKLHLGRANKPSWFSEANKKDFVIIDIPEQIKLIEQYSPDSKDPIAKRKAWLEKYPDRTQSKF